MTRGPAPSSDAAARAVLAAAAEVEAAEVAIKNEIITAAKAGDTARVIDIVQRWLSMPSVEVLGTKHALRSCGESR